jgi:hypothetical protein
MQRYSCGSNVHRQYKPAACVVAALHNGSDVHALGLNGSMIHSNSEISSTAARHHTLPQTQTRRSVVYVPLIPYTDSNNNSDYYSY